jgi:gamma-glutamylaminecyclotransferase
MKMFVYGTLKRGHGNNHYLRNCEFLGEALSLKPEFAMSGFGIPFLHEGGEQRVYGELWEVDPDALVRIDRLEGHPRHYCRRLKIFVDQQGKRHAAWVYLVDHRWGKCHEGDVLSWPVEGKNEYDEYEYDDEDEVVEPEDQTQGDVLGLDDERSEP